MTTPFTSVTSHNGLLPLDLLGRVANGDPELDGLRPDDYHLSGERPSDAIPRAWAKLQAAWNRFWPEHEASGSGLSAAHTREHWLGPLFTALDYGRLSPARPIVIDGDEYAISHDWNGVPIHLVGSSVSLDGRTKGVRGAASRHPHGLLQVLLNRDPARQWGLVSNGLQLRVLRDNASLTRQAYLEFDLEAIFKGELYADFALLWLVVHQSRFESRPGEPCWLERWLQAAKTTGIRALDDLRRGVEDAIKVLGQGFLSHADNEALRRALQSGALTPRDYYQQLLRLVYRLIFVLVAEARRLPGERGVDPGQAGRSFELLLDPTAPPEAHARYRAHYALSPLVAMARRPTSGPRHGDLYERIKLVMGLLGGRGDAAALGVSVLNGFLFAPETVGHLDQARLANAPLLEALRALGYTAEEGGRVRPVDFRALGAEELGSVYEGLLELVPAVDPTAATFKLINAQGNDRKTTGSYYTPTSLIKLLLDSALEPVIAQALKQKDKETALLALRVIDPACGSGHFLVAAAQRLAQHLARVRTGEPEPPPAAVQHALRDVVRRCIYGVDVNPMAIELAKVGLWLEALEPGKPLTFLDHHLRAGNSLIGLGPGQTVDEIPDAAFTAVAGDDKKVAKTVRERNAKHRKGGQLALGFGATLDPAPARAALTRERQALEAMADDTPEQIAAKTRAFAEAERSPDYARLKAEADLWTAAFFWPLTADTPLDMAPTQGALLDLRTGNPNLFLDAILKAATQICTQIGALHWPLAFPEVSEAGGFDVVLGNPPWERIKLQEQEFFAVRDPAIADARNKAERQKLIAKLPATNPALAAAFSEAKHQAESEALFAKHSGRFPLTAVGDMNTYALFSEHFRSLLAPQGRAGLIVPTGIATDDTTKAFFGDLTATRTLAQLLDFENREGLFPAVDSRMKFCLLTLSGQATAQAGFVFFATRVEHTTDGRRRFALAADDIARFNPNTRTMPIFRTAADAELTGKIYARVPVLENEATGESPWGVRFATLFHMSNDSHLFKTVAGAGLVPLYEAKLMHQYDHRWATYVGDKVHDLTEAEKADPGFTVTPRYWVPQAEVDKALTKTDRAGKVLWQWSRGWLLGWRDITNATNERTAIFSVLPRVGVGNKVPLFFVEIKSLSLFCSLVANLSSIPFDFVARQKIGGTTLNFFLVKQLPVLPPAVYAEPDIHFIVPRVVELVYTAHDLAPFADDVLAEVGAEQWAAWFPQNALTSGKPRPFAWDSARRAVLRAELDAYYAKLYGLTRDELRYILDPAEVYGPDFPGETFRVLKERELREYGEYRTRRLVLEAWDRLGAGSQSANGLASL